MSAEEGNPRSEIPTLLKLAGYTIVERQSDVSDPFTWSLVARKGEYEIRCEERHVSLLET